MENYYQIFRLTNITNSSCYCSIGCSFFVTNQNITKIYRHNASKKDMVCFIPKENIWHVDFYMPLLKLYLWETIGTLTFSTFFVFDRKKVVQKVLIKCSFLKLCIIDKPLCTPPPSTYRNLIFLENN